MTGVGVDIVKVERFENISERFFERVFTTREREYLAGKNAQSCAGIFAAKEAVAKALGTGFVGISPSDIEILHNENGAPYVNFDCGKKIHISISHTATDAIAFAVIE
jgi:phosphopantetheine--protein transferase-like protein